MLFFYTGMDGATDNSPWWADDILDMLLAIVNLIGSILDELHRLPHTHGRTHDTQTVRHWSLMYTQHAYSQQFTHRQMIDVNVQTTGKTDTSYAD